MAKKKASSGRGGRREGAGRPRQFTEPRTLGVVMDRVDLEQIEQVAESAGKAVSEWAREKLIAAAKRAAK